MPGRPWVLRETALRTLREERWELAVLPWGATEPHNLHLPYGTDAIEAEAVAVEAARLAWGEGSRVVVLPTIPLGVNAQQMGAPLTLNLNPSTQARILEDVVASLAHHGVPRLVVLNGHGGNDFRPMIRELQPRTPVFLCAIDWYRVVPPGAFFDEAGDHAGELETSVMLHLEEGWVHPLAEAGPGLARPFRVKGLREGWAWAPRDWERVTDDTGVGDPSAATADKGRRYFEAVTAEIGGFLTELAAADPTEMYDPGGS